MNRLEPETGGAPPLVLMVDDEPDIRAFVRRTVESLGFGWAEAATAADGLAQAQSLKPDVVLLDLGLPDRDGMLLLADLVALPVPVVVLSARGREADKVAALDAGAEDYLTKPFGNAELAARIKVVLRRRPSPDIDPGTDVVTFGPLAWHRDSRRVFLSGTEVHLTPLEYRLFTALALQPGKILTHRWLLHEVWDRDTDEMVHYVRIAIAGLRKKLEPPGGPRFVHNEVGVGYRFFDA